MNIFILKSALCIKQILMISYPSQFLFAKTCFPLQKCGKISVCIRITWVLWNPLMCTEIITCILNDAINNEYEDVMKMILMKVINA